MPNVATAVSHPHRGALRPPAPLPREKQASWPALLWSLVDNPLRVWTRAHFEERFVRSGLPFLPAVVLSDPHAIEHVLLGNADNYRKDDLLQRILAPALSNGLLTVEGDRWRKQRRSVAPMFSRKAVQRFAPPMVAAVDTLIARWNGITDGATIDVAEDMTRLTLDVLQRTIFSTGIGEDPETIRNAMRVYFDTIGKIDPFDALGLPRFLPRPTRYRARDSLKIFDGAIDAIISDRQKCLREDPGSAPRDILTLLFEARAHYGADGLDDTEIRANILTLIAAGHETTANALTWSIFLLSRAPEWLEKVTLEADAAFELPVEHVCDALPVTRAVIDEALRLYPPISAISRVAIRDDQIDGQSVRAGTMVIIAPYVVHRHRLLWRDPDIFDPGRFLPPMSQSVPRFAYLPFGAGPRICLGAAFALQEATLALGKIMRAFRLALKPGTKVEPMLRITLRPKGGLPMVLSRRRGTPVQTL